MEQKKCVYCADNCWVQRRSNAGLAKGHVQEVRNITKGWIWIDEGLTLCVLVSVSSQRWQSTKQAEGRKLNASLIRWIKFILVVRGKR